MVSSTLCPAVHILGSQNVYDRAEGIADHYWPWAIFFQLLQGLSSKILDWNISKEDIKQFYTYYFIMY